MATHKISIYLDGCSDEEAVELALALQMTANDSPHYRGTKVKRLQPPLYNWREEEELTSA